MQVNDLCCGRFLLLTPSSAKPYHEQIAPAAGPQTRFVRLWIVSAFSRVPLSGKCFMGWFVEPVRWT